MERSQAEWEAELLRAGYSFSQIRQLMGLAIRNKDRIDLEKLTTLRRQEFVRWLYKTGRLAS